jgi:hypothetical protein
MDSEQYIYLRRHRRSSDRPSQVGKCAFYLLDILPDRGNPFRGSRAHRKYKNRVPTNAYDEILKERPHIFFTESCLIQVNTHVGRQRSPLGSLPLDVGFNP